MKKAAQFILKSIALGLAIGGVVFVLTAYWDKIVDSFYNFADKLEERRAEETYEDEEEYEDDFADWESC